MGGAFAGPPVYSEESGKSVGDNGGESGELLDYLCNKALLVDSWHNGKRKFVMPPPMAGFNEFALP